MEYIAMSSKLAWYKGVSSTQPSINSPSLSIDIASTIAGQEQHYSGNLVGNTPSHERIELSNLTFRASFSRHLVHRARHTRLDDTRAHSVASDAHTRQLIRRGLHDTDDSGLGGGVVGGAGIGAQASY